jgi:2-dehydro-3-deoxygalactonokinase
MSEESALTDLDWIAADWGTSALRVWAIGGDGAVIASAASDDGMGKLEPEEFEPALLKLVGGWLPGGEGLAVPVIICGMAGAKQGWAEAPYRSVPCAPVKPGHLTEVTTKDPRMAVSIIPGLSQADPPDVMRGEETQLAGLIAGTGSGDAIVCMPGTHSKWVRLENSRVTEFTTFMTGEAFSLFAGQSVLRHSVDTIDEDRDAFLSGVAELLDKPEHLTSLLFGIRAGSLLAGMNAAQSRSRLSGLLIGGELAATRPLWSGREVHLVGSSSLAGNYAMALQQAGARPVVEDAEALNLAGLAIAQHEAAPTTAT